MPAYSAARKNLIAAVAAVIAAETTVETKCNERAQAVIAFIKTLGKPSRVAKAAQMHAPQISLIVSGKRIAGPEVIERLLKVQPSAVIAADALVPSDTSKATVSLVNKPVLSPIRGKVL